MPKSRTQSSQSEIKTIIFDLGNVLLLYDAKRAAKRFAKECKVPLYKVWLHFFTSPTEKAYTRGEMSSLEFYRHAKKALQFPVDYKTFSYYWNDIFTENPGMDKLLTKLGKKYPLYLISNTNKLHFDYIKKNFNVLRHFKRVFPSHVVGMRKPDKKIFQSVLKKIKYKPREAVFIDDTLSFVLGAKSAGLHAIRFKGKKELIQSLKKLNVTV